MGLCPHRPGARYNPRPSPTRSANIGATSPASPAHQPETSWCGQWFCRGHGRSNQPRSAATRDPFATDITGLELCASISAKSIMGSGRVIPSGPRSLAQPERSGGSPSRRALCLDDAGQSRWLLRRWLCRCRSRLLAAFEQVPQAVRRTALLAVVLRRRFGLLPIFSGIGKMYPVYPVHPVL